MSHRSEESLVTALDALAADVAELGSRVESIGADVRRVRRLLAVRAVGTLVVPVVMALCCRHMRRRQQHAPPAEAEPTA